MKHPETARRIQYAMDLNGLKAAELAKSSGVDKASISQYVNGTHAPKNHNAGRIAKVLGVDPVWLMGFDVPMFDFKKDKEIMNFVEIVKALDSDRKARLLSYAKFLSEKEGG